MKDSSSLVEWNWISLLPQLRPLHEAPSLVEQPPSPSEFGLRHPPEFKQVPDGKLAESYHNLALLAFTTDASEGANGSHFNTLAITASLNEMAD